MRYLFRLIVVLTLTSVASLGQTSTSDDLKKSIDSLTETQKAILTELQAIRSLLAQQGQARPAADVPTALMDISKDTVKGTAAAKVALIEFSDYQCPYCGRYDKETYPLIVKNYVESGKVKYVWRDYPLDFHPNAEKAAEAARCAGEQGKFWDMHDRLFANQQSISSADLIKHGESLGMNTVLFQQCLDSNRYATDIKKGVVDAGTAGISGTPSFLIGVIQPNGTVKIARKLVGAKPYADFQSAIDSLLIP